MNFEFSDLTLEDLLRLNLSYGKANARTQAELALACETSVRAVQQALESLKRAGVPVVTGSPGVWLSNSPSELRAFYRANRRRIATQYRNARGTLKAITALEGVTQTTIWEEAA